MTISFSRRFLLHGVILLVN